VFFLSTGRCGTQWFSELLARDKSLAVFHSPIPSLASQSKEVYEMFLGNNDSFSSKEKILVKEIFWSAREDHLRYTYKSGKRYIETNNYITFFAREILEIFPDAKFVHLVRHPGEFIRSGISRNYYGGGVRDLMRPLPKNGDSGKEWDSKSSLEKVAWLWNQTNSFIENFTSELQDDQKYFMNLNTMNLESVSKLCEFVEAKISTGSIRRSIKKKTNIQAKHTIQSFDKWEQSEKDSLVRITEGLLNKYGYSF
jgi:hypothetical protein